MNSALAIGRGVIHNDDLVAGMYAIAFTTDGKILL